MSWKVKICGVTSAMDANFVCESGADAIGLNFFHKSPRFLSLDKAHEIRATIPPGVAVVGLFVNAPAQQVLEYSTELQLDFVQLHGDEPPEYLREISGVKLIKAFRLRGRDLGPVDQFLASCRKHGRVPDLVLVDAYDPSLYGGTGRRVDWQVLAEAPRHDWPPLVLAGGLTPENVSEAILTVRPAAVDVASGVEIAAGKKSPKLVREFVTRAKEAFLQIARSPA